MWYFGHGEDGDGEQTARFRNCRDRDELVVDVLGLLGLGLGVCEVAGVAVVTCVCSTLLDYAHGAPATAAFPCLSLGFQKSKKRDREREEGNGGGEEGGGELGFAEALPAASL